MAGRREKTNSRLRRYRLNLEEQLKLAESGHIPILDDHGNVIGWASPVQYFTKEDLDKITVDEYPFRDKPWEEITFPDGSSGWWFLG